MTFIASMTSTGWPARTWSPTLTKRGAPGCGARYAVPTIGAFTAPAGSASATGVPAGADGGGIETVTAGVAGALRTTRMRRSPCAYSISLRPVSSSSAASARTRSPSTVRSLCFVIDADSIAVRFEQPRHRLERQQIALGSEAADHTGRGATHQRTVPESLAAVNVGQVHLDDRQLGRKQGVENRDRGGGVAGGIDDDAVGVLARLLDPLDELAFLIRLPEIDRETEHRAALHARLLDIGERVAAIGFGLAHAEEVEIRTVKNQNRRAGHRGSPETS